MYQVKKVQNPVIEENGKRFSFSGVCWGVFDENGNLRYTTNRHGNRIYDVYDYKYVAQHVVDCYIKKGI